MAEAASSLWNGRKRILLVEDHPFTRMGMALCISSQPDLLVCGEAADSREALKLVEITKADLVITDLSLPGRGGLELIKDLRALHPDLSVLVVSMHDEPMFAERVLLAGARGYVMKTQGPQRLIPAIRQVLQGRIYVSEEISAHILEHFAGHQAPKTAPVSRMTDRELEIFLLLGQARSSREIAEEFGISIKTVETHVGNLKQKCGVASLRELTRLAVCWLEERRHSQEGVSLEAGGK